MQKFYRFQKGIYCILVLVFLLESYNLLGGSNPSSERKKAHLYACIKGIIRYLYLLGILSHFVAINNFSQGDQSKYFNEEEKQRNKQNNILNTIVRLFCTYMHMSALVCTFLQLSAVVCTCLHLSALVCNCVHLSALACTCLHLSAIVYTCLHLPACVCTCVHMSALVFTCLHFSALVCTCLHLSALVCTCLHFSALVWTCHHFSALIFTCLVIICPELEEVQNVGQTGVSW